MVHAPRSLVRSTPGLGGLDVHLYLVRHGEAALAYPDGERPLTDRGERDIEELGRWAASQEVQVEQVLHSGLDRARGTAEILARHLDPPQGVSATSGLGPDDDPRSAWVWLVQETRNLAVVTHLPFVSELTSLLVEGDPHRQVVPFRPGTLAHLVRGEDGWSLEGFVSP